LWRPAIDLLSGAEARAVACWSSSACGTIEGKPGLAHFLPARVGWGGGVPQVKALRWQGSGDIAALSNANCFLVVPADREKIEIGESVSVLLRKDVV